MLPKGEGLARNAILALSKFGETVRTSRLNKYLLILALGGVRGAVKECRRANTGAPVKNLKVRSRLETLCHVAESVISIVEQASWPVVRASADCRVVFEVLGRSWRVNPAHRAAVIKSI